MKRYGRLLTLGAVLGCMTAASSVAQSIEDTVIREGQGPRGESLRDMERQPLPTKAWEALSQWTNSSPVDSLQTRGKVVLFVTFSSWNRTSHPALSTARRLHEQYADDGLVVIGVHDKAGWEEAAGLLASRMVEFPVALDTNGTFRSTLFVDQDPDFYLVDRAGQLRFADIMNSEVSKAVRQLVEESEADAASLNERIELYEKKRRRDDLRAKGLGHTIAPGEELQLDFTLPSDDVYQAANWPWSGVMWLKSINDTQYQFDWDWELVKVTFPDQNWMPAKPDMQGKVVLLYYMHPISSHSDNVPAMMQRLQRKYPHELVVVGAVPEYEWIEDKKNPDKKSEEELRQMLLNYARNNFNKIRRRDETITHPFVVATPEITGKNANNIAIVLLGEQGRRNDTAVWLLDSQHNVRWSGYSWFQNFETTLAKLIEADPGVQARRNAIEDLKLQQSLQTRRSDGDSSGNQGSTPAATDNVEWPAHNSGRLTAINMQGKRLPKTLGKETFLTSKPDTDGKILVLDFWATWCGPCRRASPILDQLQKQYPNQLAVIGISDESIDTVQKYVDDHATSYAIATDTSANIKKSLSVSAIPHVVVVSTDGIVRWQGNPLSKDFRQTVLELIKVDPGL